jgi:hypothetical protein
VSEAQLVAGVRADAPPAGDGRASAEGAAEWLRLAAAPTFAVMALLTALPGAGPLDQLCSASHAGPLGGMTAMYLLMSAFHAPPWVRLFLRT